MPVSEVPIPSAITHLGNISLNSDFICLENIAPPDPKCTKLDKFHFLVLDFKAFNKGIAIASPTICKILTPSCSTLSQISWALNPVLIGSSTKVIPPNIPDKAVHIAAPCINGAHGRIFSGGLPKAIFPCSSGMDIGGAPA